MYTLPLKINLPPSKPVTVNILRELGRGICGIVVEVLIDERHRALKLYYDESAYASITKTPSLYTQTASFHGTFDRVPELFPAPNQIYSRGICLEKIHGPSLYDIIVTLSAAQRDAIRVQLRHTLSLLHEGAGVVHRDVRAPNVILAEGGARLIDFSHAGFKHDMVPSLWDKRKAEDYELLDRIFKKAEEMVAEQISQKILDRLTPGITADRNKQSELAAVLHNLSPSSTLLLAIEKQIPNPTPVLALSLTRAYKQFGKKEAAIKFAKSYLSRIKETGYKSPDIRQFLVLKITFARYQGTLCFEDRITLFEEIIAEFTQYLGETHICTLQARFECAQLWFREQRSVKTSLIQCVEILCTLYRFGNDNREGIVHFKDHWKNKVLELIQTCKEYLDKDDLLQRKRRCIKANESTLRVEVKSLL